MDIYEHTYIHSHRCSSSKPLSPPHPCLSSDMCVHTEGGGSTGVGWAKHVHMIVVASCKASSTSDPCLGKHQLRQALDGCLTQGMVSKEGESLSLKAPGMMVVRQLVRLACVSSPQHMHQTGSGQQLVEEKPCRAPGQPHMDAFPWQLNMYQSVLTHHRPN